MDAQPAGSERPEDGTAARDPKRAWRYDCHVLRMLKAAEKAMKEDPLSEDSINIMVALRDRVHEVQGRDNLSYPPMDLYEGLVSEKDCLEGGDRTHEILKEALNAYKEAYSGAETGDWIKRAAKEGQERVRALAGGKSLE
ncbi:hypothetical protein ISF_00049 [Cordyceps fumosorosea ARSEF 2679]|uniref:Uncharacterized protein n=1 Tax=Cordyceps fumosorosea (strain ARSEF 2679) TaxID=1081104 RepID=A0A168DY63_CORFA|nr:hypothetical protein ISF_00049 [Cordyceps fumosorosea ARSEF 2679]OAA73148.1 hypothetical protein ISF_00049 [Cordyceps fumosorosea ARSEF 2679]